MLINNPSSGCCSDEFSEEVVFGCSSDSLGAVGILCEVGIGENGVEVEIGVKVDGGEVGVEKNSGFSVTNGDV